MAGLLDFVFGAGALKKAAQTGEPSKPGSPAPSPTAAAADAPAIDMQAEAQKAADRARAAQAKAKAAAPAVESSPGYDWKRDKRNAK